MRINQKAKNLKKKKGKCLLESNVEMLFFPLFFRYSFYAYVKMTMRDTIISM